MSPCPPVGSEQGMWTFTDMYCICFLYQTTMLRQSRQWDFWKQNSHWEIDWKDQYHCRLEFLVNEDMKLQDGLWIGWFELSEVARTSMENNYPILKRTIEVRLTSGARCRNLVCRWISPVQEFNNGELELEAVSSMCFKFADGSITDDTGRAILLSRLFLFVVCDPQASSNFPRANACRKWPLYIPWPSRHWAWKDQPCVIPLQNYHHGCHHIVRDLDDEWSEYIRIYFQSLGSSCLTCMWGCSLSFVQSKVVLNITHKLAEWQSWQNLGWWMFLVISITAVTCTMESPQLSFQAGIRWTGDNPQQVSAIAVGSDSKVQLWWMETNLPNGFDDTSWVIISTRQRQAN